MDGNTSTTRRLVRGALMIVAAVLSTAVTSCYEPAVIAGPAAPADTRNDTSTDLSRVPASWQGEWQVQTTVADCLTAAIFQQPVTQDFLCSGVSVIPAPEDFDIDVISEEKFTDRDVTIACTGRCRLDGCETLFDYEFSGRRVGDRFTGNGVLRISVIPSRTCAQQQMCFRFGVAADRVGDVPAAGCPETRGNALFGLDQVLARSH